jgi:hypothetical protein
LATRGSRLWVGVFVLLAAAPALAQSGGGPPDAGQPGGIHQRGRSNTGGNKPANPPLPPIKAAPEPWPRLDPGAMLCRSKDALKQYQEAMATATGDEQPPIPADCARVLVPTPISIVQRDGPSRVEVKSTKPPERDGWTDAWLPDKQP